MDEGCKNCGRPLVYFPGKKKKIFCDDYCRQQHWQKKKPKEEKTKVFNLREWQKIQQQLETAGIEIPKAEYVKKEPEEIRFKKIDSKPVLAPVIQVEQESMPEGLSWQERIEWLRTHRKK